jgi:hypothetical protein
MKPLTKFILIALTISSCSTTKDKSDAVDKSTISDKTKYFKEVFIKKFRPTDLPLTLRPAETGGRIKTNPKSADTLFFRDGVTYVTCYGMLPDTSKYYGVIWQAMADLDPPSLTTYTKQGDIIDETNLYVGKCGGIDCGWSCSETIKIDEHHKIFSIDTVMTWDCDSLRGNLKKSIFYKSGHVDDNGKIIMTVTKEESIK